MLRRPSLLTIALVTSTVGCGVDLGMDSATRGQEDRASFSFRSWHECAFGCPVDRPMMVGTTERIGMVPDDVVPGLVALSSDGAVVVLGTEQYAACCRDSDYGRSCTRLDGSDESTCPDTIAYTYAVDLEARAVGSANLALHHPDGALYDWIPVTVQAPERLSAVCRPNRSQTAGSIDLYASEQCSYEIDAFAAEDLLLQASHGFTVRVADLDVAALHEATLFDIFPVPLAELSDAHGEVDAIAPGQTQLTIQTAGLQLDLAVVVH